MHYIGEAERTACGAWAAPGEVTAMIGAVQCPVCLGKIFTPRSNKNENEAKKLGFEICALFCCREDERILSAGQYHDCIIVTTTERVWRIKNADIDQEMRIQIVAALRGCLDW